MPKVTSKLQITIPKAIAEKYGIKPGDNIEFRPTAMGIYIVPGEYYKDSRVSLAERKRLFAESTGYVEQRAKELNIQPVEDESVRDWTREELYTRGGSD